MMIAMHLPIANDVLEGFDDAVAAHVAPEIAPHLANALTPAVHRYGRGWSVSDVETGERITGVNHSLGTRALAMQQARTFLLTKTVDDVIVAQTNKPKWMKQ